MRESAPCLFARFEGFGDLPVALPNFAVSLPHWNEPTPPKPFAEMRSDCAIHAKGSVDSDVCCVALT